MQELNGGDGRGEVSRRRLTRPALAVALACLCPSAMGANWFVETGVVSQLTATTNSTYESRNDRESDVIVSLAPTITLRGEGRRMRVAGAAALGAITYIDGTQNSSIDPVGRFTANIEAIEKWFYVDSDLSATRSVINPLGARPDGPSSFNQQTNLTARLSPYIDRTFSNDVRLLIRSDNAWTDIRRDGEQAPTEYSARHFFSVSRAPRPLGLAIEAERRRDDRIDAGSDTAAWYDLARIRVGWLLGSQLEVGARGGYERSELFVEDSSVSFWGVELAWRPTERTRFEGFWEDRSFGDAASLSFSHRAPRIAWDLRATRDLTTFDDAALSLPATGDLAALLNAALQTRIVDPVERARAVEDFIARRGLPRALQGPINVFSDQVIVRTLRTGTVTFIGVRTTVALTGFFQGDKTPAADLLSLTGDASEVKQYGATLAFSRRLSNSAAIVSSASWSRTRDALGTSNASAAPRESKQQVYRVQLDQQLAPRTTGFVGVRYQKLLSQIEDDAHEAAVFAGLAHRF
jgi:uncharacterized protein (PEP-CTERM system associated)